jgi:NADP-dependent 3-hydroxy acid dehydrogenase YdfG
VRVTDLALGRTRTRFGKAASADAQAGEDVMTGFILLEADDIADAAIYALDAPWRVTISLMEICLTERTFGGVGIRPVGDQGSDA